MAPVTMNKVSNLVPLGKDLLQSIQGAIKQIANR
jgi:hypothetical protein